MDGEAAAAENQPQPDPALMENPGAPDGSQAPGGRLDENDLPVGEEVKQESLIPEEILNDMKKVWSVFDLEMTEKIEIRHLRTIMRALDFDLNADEL